MKILHINAQGKYSTGNIAQALIKKYDGEGFFCYSFDDVQEEFAKKYYTKSGFWLDLLMTRITGFEGIWSFLNTGRILRDIKKFSPDIIHLHNLHGCYINYVRLFRFIKKNNIKVIWTLHDCWSFTGYCPHFDFIGCEKWKTECNHCPRYKEWYMKSWFFDFSTLKYRLKKKTFCGVKDLTIVTPSKWLSEKVEQSFLKNYPIKVINNGINTEKFSITENTSFKSIIPNNKKIVIAVASSWDERKGLKDIIEISRRIKEDYIVLIVGVTAIQAEQLKNERIITVEKTNNQQQLAELYSLSEVFINTTYEENYPTVNLEALCCGCPVITYSTGGSTECIKETNGMVVAKGNVEEMLYAIYSISGKQYDRQAISSEAKNRFSSDVMLNKYIDIYENKG